VKKFINKPENFVEEMIEGIVAAHPNQLEYLENNPRCIVKKDRSRTKVGIVTGGGSGHLPLFLGYVGEGLLDGCAVGGVFQSPGADKVYEVTRAVNKGMGVLYIIGNYMGDIMNFEISAEMAEMDGIETKTIIGMDDVASAPKTETKKRRGVAGIFYVYKAAGALADLGGSLEEVYRVAEKAAKNVRTMGVAISPCIIPEVGKPSFMIDEDEMEIGMGIHGEPGIRRGKLRCADEIVTEMLTAILDDLETVPGDEVSILVNGLGATCKEELYIINKRISEILREKEITTNSTYIGEFATSMEMAGFSISIIRLDEELKVLIRKSANTPFFTQFAY
jgi:phosphoenolpyruvate---glycerone phosphotransferase subunit DhaK